MDDNWIKTRCPIFALIGFWYTLSTNVSVALVVPAYTLSCVCFILFIWVLIKKRFKKVAQFCISLTILIWLLPVVYYSFYISNNNNYSYEDRILKKNKNYSESEISNYRDSNEIRSLLVKFDDSTLKSAPINNRLYGGYYFKEQSAGLWGRPYDLMIFDAENNFIIKSRYPEKNAPLFAYINGYLSYLEETKDNIINSTFIYFRDIMLESITGFLFGDISVNSAILKAIRIFHLCIVFYWVALLTSLLNSYSFLEMTRKK